MFVLFLIATPALAQDTGLAVWSKIYEVFSHPPLREYVGPDNVPIWSGPTYGPKARPHGMNINGGSSRAGAEYIACKACHSQHNAPAPHGPPGAKRWQLAPVTMQWFGKSSTEICAQIKDPAHNGGRTVAEVARPGWAPAPYSALQMVEFLKQWDAAGAPCPTK